MHLGYLETIPPTRDLSSAPHNFNNKSGPECLGYLLKECSQHNDSPAS
jgi:hypothetical protein